MQLSTKLYIRKGGLAWKLALVLKHRAGPALLDSYDQERQPVGKQIVQLANKGMVQKGIVWDMLGGGTRRVMTAEEHAAVFDTPHGRAQGRWPPTPRPP
jgi:2-polyprenyl-6-methoxyphenol hydroxylase-like FAD-dependent oxidoreductase